MTMPRVRDDDGATIVTDGTRDSQPHNRYAGPVSETQAGLGHMTFTEEEAVYRIRFKAVALTGAPVAGDLVRVVFDAAPVDDSSNDAQAWAWLGDPPLSEDTDVEFFEFPFVPASSVDDADAVWSRWYTFAAPLRSVDFRYPGGTEGSVELAIHGEIG